MNYTEWRKRTAGISAEKLLERAYTIMKEWNNLGEDQADNILKQLQRETIKDDPCWEECLPGATMNFVNWGI